MLSQVLLLCPFEVPHGNSIGNVRCLTLPEALQESALLQVLREEGPFRDLLVDVPISEASHAVQRLNDLFRIIQWIYRTVMRSKGTRIWLLCRANEKMSTHTEQSIIHAALAGIQALAQVSAMELSTKGVAVNTLTCKGEFSLEQLTPILQWSAEEKSLFMTARNIQLRNQP